MFIEVLFSLMELLYMFDPQGNNNFNIKNGAKITTFGDYGYTTVLVVGQGEEKAVLGVDKGVKCEDGVCLFTTMEYWQEKAYVRITYTVKNANNVEKNFSIGTRADIQIDQNDKARVINMKQNRGFTMENDVLAIEVIARDCYGVINVDTYWYGKLQYMYIKQYSSGTNDSPTYSNLENMDSAMALSWKNRKIQPKEEQNFSFLIGFGEFHNHPDLIMIDIPGPEYRGGETVYVSGQITHTDSPRKGVLIVAIDGKNSQVVSGQVDISRTSNIADGTFVIPKNLTKGSHVFSFWAKDDLNMTSIILDKSFKFTPIDPPRTPSITPSETLSLTPSITASETPSNTPSITPSEALSSTSSTTPSITHSITPSVTPSNTPYQTSYDSPFITPLRTNLPTGSQIIIIPSLSETNESKITEGAIDKNGKNFSTIIEKRWIVYVVIASFVIFAMIVILALIIYSLIKKESKSEESSNDNEMNEELTSNVNDVPIMAVGNDLSADDSGETVDISNEDIDNSD